MLGARARVFVLLWAFALGAGCPGGGNNGGADAGTEPDATTSPDATTEPDATTSPDAGSDASPDAGGPVDAGYPDGGTLVEGFAGPGGPYVGPDNCVYWGTLEGDMRGVPETSTGGGTLIDENGEPIEFPPGTTVAPRGMCNSHTVDIEVIRETKEPQLPPPGDPRCTPTDTSGCPDSSTEPRVPPAYRPGSPEPVPPFPFDDQPIMGSCSDGFGFSFANGTLAPWTGSGGVNSPVFGNNVSIKRLKPPGFPWEPGPATNPWDLQYPVEYKVGGDYWEFSRDINQRGNWWYGTVDLRPSHQARPGYTQSERGVSELTSPSFTIDASYLAFRLGGSADAHQRVELRIQANDVADAGTLANSYEGIGNVEFPEGTEYMPVPMSTYPQWVIVRASAPLEESEWMGRQVIWDVDQYRGRTAQLVVIDHERIPATEPRCMLTNCVYVDRMAHINVDDFQCMDTVPDDVEWMKLLNMDSNVGHVVTPQPIWGFTESHSHATANLSFGGHMIWGDVADDLEHAYNCLQDLPAIQDAAGTDYRPAIRDPRRAISCNMKAEIVAVLNATVTGVCMAASGPLDIIPFLGQIVFAACKATIDAVSALLLSTPLVTGHYYHGAQMPTSGGLEVGPILQPVVGSLLELFSEGDIRTEDLHIHGMVEQRDFDSPDGTHSGQGLGQFHNHYQKDMIRRAFDGGLRLMVIDVHNSRAMQGILDGPTDYDDWTAIRDHVAALERLTAPPGDPTWGSAGVLSDIAEIALTPAQARDIIGRGKMAIIIGVEVMELGKARFAGDTVQSQITELYDMGVRKITPIHSTDNPLGGTALFQDVYQAANVFNNLTLNEAGETDDALWDPLIPPVPIALPSTFPFPFAEMNLGLWGIVDSLKARPCGAGCEWSNANQGFFTVVETLPAADDIVGELEEVTFRLGFPSTSHLWEPADRMGRTIMAWEVEPKAMTANRAYSLQWLLGAGPGGPVAIPQCSLEGMYVPLEMPPPDDVRSGYDSLHERHINARGLTSKGEEFLREMMKRGMYLDTDHFSQATRNGAFPVVEAFAMESMLPASKYPRYAVFGVHTELRGFEFGGPIPDVDTLVAAGGYESEISRTHNELQWMAESGGTITMSVPGFIPDPAPYGADVVALDCDYSSKAYAHKYLRAVELMGGRGVTPGYDMNGFAPHIAPRYGLGSACRTGVTNKALRVGAYSAADVADPTSWHETPHLAAWPRDWMEPGEDCRYNGSVRDSDKKPECPSSWMIKQQREEFTAVLYDDYATRISQAPPFISPADPNLRMVLARGRADERDDRAPRVAEDEWVYVGGGGEFRQIRPLVKWRNDGVAVGAMANTGWDYNLDGLRHIGLMPDLFQDMRNVGTTWELLTPMFNSAEDFIRMWETNCAIARAWADANGGDAAVVCD